MGTLFGKPKSQVREASRTFRKAAQAAGKSDAGICSGREACLMARWRKLRRSQCTDLLEDEDPNGFLNHDRAEQEDGRTKIRMCSRQPDLSADSINL